MAARLWIQMFARILATLVAVIFMAATAQARRVAQVAEHLEAKLRKGYNAV